MVELYFGRSYRNSVERNRSFRSIRLFKQFFILVFNENIAEFRDKNKWYHVILKSIIEEPRLMYPCVPREAQPVVCKEVKPFTISQIRKIMSSRAKKGKEKRMIQECEIDNQIEYRLISVVRLRAIIEERSGFVYKIYIV